MGYESFQKQLEEAADFFSSFDKNKQIRLVSHHDADGICSAAIIVELLNKKGMSYCITIVPQLDDEMLDTLKSEEHSQYIFTDLGSVFIKKIIKKLKDHKVLVLDHHQPSRSYSEDSSANANICHVNPHLHDIEGSREISGSGVTYMFAELIEDMSSLSHLPIVGAIGDSQANKGFNGLNETLLQKSQGSGQVKINHGLKLFGANTKPLAKLLRTSYDPFIPGVTGNFRGANEFLNSLNINVKDSGKNRLLTDLGENELNKLGEAILQRCPDVNKNRLFGKIYTITGETGAFRDAREFATVLNGCGRLDKSTVGIAACLGDESMKKKALEMQEEYKRELQSIVSWFKSNKNSEDIIITPNYLIVNCKKNVPSSMAGTFASIISYSEEAEKGAFILTLSRQENGTTKVSLRLKGRSDKVDLNLIISKIVRVAGGQSGGHKNAAGALIKSCDEKKFIEQAQRIFQEVSLVEDIGK